MPIVFIPIIYQKRIKVSADFALFRSYVQYSIGETTYIGNSHDDCGIIFYYAKHRRIQIRCSMPFKPRIWIRATPFMKDTYVLIVCYIFNGLSLWEELNCDSFQT